MAKIVAFPEQNHILQPAPGTEPYVQPLPCHASVRTEPDGQQFMVTTSCWEMSEAEIIEIVRTKRVWLQVYGGHPPSLIIGVNPIAKGPRELPSPPHFPETS